MDRSRTDTYEPTPTYGADFVVHVPETPNAREALDYATSTTELRGSLGFTAAYDANNLAFSSDHTRRPEVPESPEVAAYRTALQTGRLIVHVRKLEQALAPDAAHIRQQNTGA